MDLSRRPPGHPTCLRKLAAAAPSNSKRMGRRHPAKAILAGRQTVLQYTTHCSTSMILSLTLYLVSLAKFHSTKNEVQPLRLYDPWCAVCQMSDKLYSLSIVPLHTLNEHVPNIIS